MKFTKVLLFMFALMVSCNAMRSRIVGDKREYGKYSGYYFKLYIAHN